MLSIDDSNKKMKSSLKGVTKKYTNTKRNLRLDKLSLK